MAAKPNRLTILFLTILMAACIVVIDIAWVKNQREAHLTTSKGQGTVTAIKPEASNGFPWNGQDYMAIPGEPASERQLDTYYSNRAYPGAPPIIPHAMLNGDSMGGKSCLQCHEKGGYVAQFEAYAPITPHPEMINCTQCHLKPKTNDTFKGTNWQKHPPPTLGTSAMPGSPLVMPHGLQMKENCMACHAGPAAVAAIRVTHPERTNCRQCHVPNDRPLPTEWPPAATKHSQEITWDTLAVAGNPIKQLSLE